MKFLKMLATPFIKLWGWIKETAWVQPLLIVGCIFAVIFSIPYISSGIQGLIKEEDNTMKYYNSKRLSMSGAYKNDSKADNFLELFANAQDAWSDSNNGTQFNDEQTEAINKLVDKYGDKFFFTLSKSDCEACNNASEGFEHLEKNQKSYNVTNFKMHTIVVDQDLSENNEDDKYKIDSAFKFIFNNNSRAFDHIYESGRFSKYYSGNLADYDSYVTKLETLVKEEVANVEVPLIVLVDLSKDENDKYVQEGYEYIATQVFFEVTGESKYDTATYLSEAWNYTGDTFKDSSAK